MRLSAHSRKTGRRGTQTHFAALHHPIPSQHRHPPGRKRTGRTDCFCSEQVLPGLQAGGDGECRVPAVDEEEVGAPLAGRGVVAILPDCRGDLCAVFMPLNVN